MSHATDTQPYEELLEFVYVSPFALARMDESGAIDMMNAMGANLLLEFAPSAEITNLLDVIDGVDPEVRHLVRDFRAERGVICDARRIAIDVPERPEGFVLSLTLQKLGPGRVMAAFGDISKLEAAHRAQRFLLDNMSDGLVTVEASGLMSSECSASMARWLGSPSPGEPLWTYVARKDASFGQYLRLAWASLTAGLIPRELCLEQLPRCLHVDGLALGVTYQPLFRGETLTGVLVIMRDLTADLERERVDAEQRELMIGVGWLSTDREGFRAALSELDRLVQLLGVATTDARVNVAAALHTLKGNAGMVGLDSIAKICDSLERKRATGDLGAQDYTRLEERWGHVLAQFRGLLGEDDGRVTLTRADYDDLLAAVLAGEPREEILERVESLVLVPVESQLRRIAEQAVALGERLERAPIEVHVEAHGLRHAPDLLLEFWGAFVHAVRNAVDHGIETSTERAATGKSPTAHLRLSAAKVGGRLVIELADDGRGIDWERVAAKARAAGLPSAIREDWVAAIFSEGFSSRDAVTEISGRGVGLSALAAACATLGGSIDVESERGSGTTFRFSLPALPARAPVSAPGRQRIPKQGAEVCPQREP